MFCFFIKKSTAAYNIVPKESWSGINTDDTGVKTLTVPVGNIQQTLVNYGIRNEDASKIVTKAKLANVRSSYHCQDMRPAYANGFVLTRDCVYTATVYSIPKITGSTATIKIMKLSSKQSQIHTYDNFPSLECAIYAMYYLKEWAPKFCMSSDLVTACNTRLRNQIQGIISNRISQFK